jgi:tetratricopeptide (TPR) repeat protein
MVVLASVATSSALTAQATAAPAKTEGRLRLDRAIKLYEAFNVEKARWVLDSNAKDLSKLSNTDASETLKYLGASWAVLAQKDSAIKYYKAALKLDPTITLDPKKFSKAELTPFDQARADMTGAAGKA